MARTATTARSKPTGRPTKLTPVTQRRICDLIRKGVPRERSARLAGIGTSTFHLWMEKGRAGESPYVEFMEAICNAEDALVERAVATATDLLNPRRCKKPEVRLNAAKFILSHRFPADFSSRSEVRHEGKDGGPIAVSATVTVQPVITADVAAGLDGDQLAALAREFMAGRKG